MSAQPATRPITIVGIGGSLRRSSTSLSALYAALASARAAGAETVCMNVRDLDLPLYRPRASIPTDARSFAEVVRRSDGLIWSSPLYHGTISGAFKNALDWLELLADDVPPYLTDKPVGLIAVAGGAQALQAINTMEFAVRALRGWTVPFVVPVTRSSLDPSGSVRDDEVRVRLQMLGREVAAAAHRLRDARTAVPQVV